MKKEPTSKPNLATQNARHRFASVYYKLIRDNRIIAAGSKSGMKRLMRDYPGSFIGIGSPSDPEIGRVWNPAFPSF